jgi:hypothetical protein
MAAGGPDDYEAELERIDHSGPHDIGEEQQALNRAVAAELADLLPIDDIHKVSDCDLIYRFLIAHRWAVPKAVEGIRNYVAWRTELRLNGILWEQLPEDAMAAMPTFQGQDIFGNPVFYDRPDPKLVGQLLTKYSADEMLRMHAAVMETGRRLQKALGRDRVSCVIDCSKLTMSIVTNPSAMSLLKQMSKMDQTQYPENMRTLMICNGGWTFSGMYKLIRPLLDERVQKKIQIMGGSTGSAKMREDMGQWIDVSQVPESFSGTAPDGSIPAHPVLQELRALPPGTPPPSGFHPE